jgi:hypothetical protein
MRHLRAGCLSILVVLAAGGLVAGPAAAARRPRPAPSLPAGAQLLALSCPSSGNCAAIGSYYDGLGDSQALFVTQADGRWRTAVQARPPAGAAASPFKSSRGGGLVGIACPARGQCAAVGSYTAADAVDHGVLYQQRDGRWGQGVRLRLPADAVRTPQAHGGVADGVSLSAVACSSPGNCLAVGQYETKAEVLEPLIVRERDWRWLRGVQAPLPSDAPVKAQDAGLLTVSCAPSGACTAAGAYLNSLGHEVGLLVTGGGHFTASPAAPAPSDASIDPRTIPSAIACPTPGVCTIVGTYLNPLENSLGLLLGESGGAWQSATGTALPSDAAPAGTFGDQNTVLSSVSCPQAGACSAVGWYYDNGENSQGLALDQSGGVWQPGTEVTLPANAIKGLQKQAAGLDWVSCWSPGNCLATGVYTTIALENEGLLVTQANGVWQPAVEAPLPRGAALSQSAATVSSDCTGPGDCSVIGDYLDRRGNLQGYMLTERAGGFGRPRALVLPPASATEARLSLAAILQPPGPAARLTQLRKTGTYTYTYEAVEPGSATSAWYSLLAGRRVLIAAGHVHAHAAGPVALVLRLTAAGRTLIAAAAHLQVSARASFRAYAHQPVQHASASFTLGADAGARARARASRA